MGRSLAIVGALALVTGCNNQAEVTSATSTADATTASTSDATSTSGTSEPCTPPSLPDPTGDDTGEVPPPIATIDEYVAAECAAFLGCGCSSSGLWGKFEKYCLTTRHDRLVKFEAQGLVWDGACAAARVAAFEQACETGTVPCTRACPLFPGAAAFGEPCVIDGDAVTSADATGCGAGLRCTGGDWANPPFCVGLCDGTFGCGGERCTANQTCEHDDGSRGYCSTLSGPGGGCNLVYGPRCKPGLDCVVEDFGYTCQWLPGTCEPCEGGCDPGFACDESGRFCFQVIGGLGDPCPCEPGLACTAGHCEPGLCVGL